MTRLGILKSDTAIDMLIEPIDYGEVQQRTVKIPVRLVQRASTVGL